MGQTPAEIERHIRQERADLASNLGQIEQRAKDAVDWRLHFQKSPLTMIGVAVGAGMLLAAVTARPSRRRYPRHEEQRGNGDYYRAAAGPWDKVKGALMGVAANRFQQFLSRAVPGFHEEYHGTEARK
jgi:hypothetical protein